MLIAWFFFTVVIVFFSGKNTVFLNQNSLLHTLFLLYIQYDAKYLLYLQCNTIQHSTIHNTLLTLLCETYITTIRLRYKLTLYYKTVYSHYSKLIYLKLLQLFTTVAYSKTFLTALN